VTRRPTVLLADDHPLVCNGLKAMLEPAFSVVAMVHDGNDVLAATLRHQPDLVLLDLSLPGPNGLVLTRLLKKLAEPPRVVVVTMHADQVYIDEAVRAGADGYLLKTARATELRHALRDVLAGRRYIRSDLRVTGDASPSRQQAPPPAPDGELAMLPHLTERQRQVLLLVGQGLTNQDMASLLEVTPKAIEYHRASIRRALAITTRSGLYRVATRYAQWMTGRKGVTP